MMRTRVIAFAVALLTSVWVNAATFTVVNTNDSGAGSFRQAILDANLNAGADVIAFAIPNPGVQTITAASFWPPITDPVTIDGYTQPGSSAGTNAFPLPINAHPLIELTGVQNQLVINNTAAGTVIRGLITSGTGDTIVVNADNVKIQGNFIGTNATGTARASISGFGVRHIVGNNLTLGGPTAADRNVLAGGGQGGAIIGFSPVSTGHLIQGNFIGTDFTGTIALGGITNPVGLSNVNNAQVLNNLISGNPGGGLDTLNVTPNFGMIIRGNLIGTQANGTSPLPNGNFGGINLNISNASVGGVGAGEPNVIAFNNGAGIWVRLNQNSNPIIQNSIYSNTVTGITLMQSSPGIPLPNDVLDADTVPGNRGQNYPVLNVPVIAAGSATITGTLSSQPSKNYRIEFFANAVCGPTGFGEGQTFIGIANVTTNGSGTANIGPVTLPVPAGQSVITATATDTATSDTSEFSQCPASVGTTTGLVSSVNPSVFGQSVTFTATVSGATTPTGTVQFFDGVTSLGTVPLSGTSAALTTSSLAVGAHPITAVYSGDVDDPGSTSPVVNQVVNSAAGAATTTGLVSSLNPSVFGQSVTFTATVSGGTSPTGTVQFSEGATILATVPLAGGTAAFTTSALSVGAHPIVATYSGDVDDAGSGSPTVTQIVTSGGGGPSSGGVKPVPVLPWPLLALLAAAMGAFGWRRGRK